MQTTTKQWLRDIETCGNEARKEISNGADPLLAIKQAAHRSVEPPMRPDFDEICIEMGMTPRGNSRFAAEVECFLFSYNVIEGMATEIP